MQSHRRCQHIGVIVLVDDIFIKGVFVNERRCYLIESVSSASLPALRLGNAAGVFPGNNLIHAHFAMGIGMIAHFHANPTPPHFLCDGSGSTGTEEGIKNQIAGIGGNMDDALNKLFGFRSGKNVIFAENRHNLFL